jgi:cytoskeletal protein RodZ
MPTTVDQPPGAPPPPTGDDGDGSDGEGAGRWWWFAVAAVVVIGVIILILVLVNGGDDDDSTATTTSSSSTTSTSSTTTAPTTATQAPATTTTPPAVTPTIESFEGPGSVECTGPTTIPLSWTTQNAQRTTLAIDGGVIAEFGPSGSTSALFPCDGSDHTYLLTAFNGNNTATERKTVTQAAPAG